MKIIQTISQFQHIPKGCILTIGNFDGVHAGHQEILAVAREAAETNDTELIAMVFHPHPVAILHPEMAPGVLSPLDIKKYFLAECG
ncbi:MAG: adenylyltransferase/cytidyltransferase family protein, partial [Planctomycetota bacterium]